MRCSHCNAKVTIIHVRSLFGYGYENAMYIRHINTLPDGTKYMIGQQVTQQTFNDSEAMERIEQSMHERVRYEIQTAYGIDIEALEQ